MKYFLILGTNPALSLSEVRFYLERKIVEYEIELLSGEVAILKLRESIDCIKLIKELGGMIKIGQYFSETKKITLENLVEIVESDQLKDVDFKYKFGFSVYGNEYLNLNSYAMNLKKYFKEKNISSRWVTGKEKNLSSVIVEQNKMINKGVDFIVCKKENKYFLGKTLAVQDFKGLSKRDYGRPERDDESGMLPPKLAQIMINLSGIKNDGVLLDPFCGSGTVLSEAALMGIKKIVGSDLSEKAVEDSMKNLRWIKKNNNVEFNLNILKSDSTKISQNIPNLSIDSIVTEPYLGPQRGSHDLRKTVSFLEDLYSKSLQEFRKIMKKNGSIVMVWPVFVSREGDKKKLFLEKIKTDGYKIIPLLPEDYLNSNYLSLSRRGGIIYGRPGQKIWREIILLRLQ